MKTFALSTGSSGNCIYVETKYGGFLIDCGLSFSKTQQLLSKKNIDIFSIKGVLLTHEHADHVAGLEQCMKQLSCPFYATKGTIEMLGLDVSLFEIISDHQVLSFKDTNILVVKKPHDAKEPVSFIIQEGKNRVGIFTDLGHITSSIKTHLKHCNCLYLEVNYSIDFIKKYCNQLSDQYLHRLTSSTGHLGIHQVNEILEEILEDNDILILSHISENTISYELAYSEIKKTISSLNKKIILQVSFQKEAMDVILLDNLIK
jgi:phosphoribosyl 1,2-cyclic phosphodiesterase